DYNPNNPLIHVTANLSYAVQKIDSTYVWGSSTLPSGMVGMAADPGTAAHRYRPTKLTATSTAAFASGSFQHDLRTGSARASKEREEAYSAPGGTDRRFAAFIVDDITSGGWTISPALRYETQKVEPTNKDVIGLPKEFDNEAIMGGLSL